MNLKCTIIIDDEREEEVLIYTKKRNKLFNKKNTWREHL